jgi:hypothetical protein
MGGDPHIHALDQSRLTAIVQISGSERHAAAEEHLPAEQGADQPNRLATEHAEADWLEKKDAPVAEHQLRSEVHAKVGGVRDAPPAA